jgi:hypothetical protein
MREIVVDTETTGLDPLDDHRTVEIFPNRQDVSPQTKLVAGSLALTSQLVYRTEFLSRRRARVPFNRVIEFNDLLTCRR